MALEDLSAEIFNETLPKYLLCRQSHRSGKPLAMSHMCNIVKLFSFLSY